MKHFTKMYAITLLLILANVAFSFDYGFKMPVCDYGYGYGPGTGIMRQREGGPGYERGEMMGRFEQDGIEMGSWVFYYIPDIRNIMDNYNLKIQKVFLETKEVRLKYVQQRRELLPKLDEIVEEYKSDKISGKEVVNVLKEIKTISDKIQSINNEAMKKIKDLNDQRGVEINKALDNWLKKMDGDEKELQKFIEYYNNSPRFHMGYRNNPTTGKRLKSR